MEKALVIIWDAEVGQDLLRDSSRAEAKERKHSCAAIFVLDLPHCLPSGRSSRTRRAAQSLVSWLCCFELPVLLRSRLGTASAAESDVWMAQARTDAVLWSVDRKSFEACGGRSEGSMARTASASALGGRPKPYVKILQKDTRLQSPIPIPRLSIPGRKPGNPLLNNIRSLAEGARLGCISTWNQHSAPKVFSAVPSRC